MDDRPRDDRKTSRASDPMEGSVLALGLVSVDVVRRVAYTPHGEHALSQLEVDLLGYLYARAGRDVAREELLTQVWGHRRVTETRAVDMAVMRLRKKVEVDPAKPKLILATRGDGYRLTLPPAASVPAGDGAVGVEGSAPGVPARRLRTNLSRASGALFGVSELLSRLTGELVAGERVLSLEGPPGVGKTRLARELGLIELASERWQEVWMVELGEARGLDGLCLATAEVLDLETGAQPDALGALHGIGHALAARREVLLILDRAEHLREVVSEAVRVWLRRAPRLAVIVTTQARLHLGGERSFVIPALEVEDAMALFRDRALRVGAPELPPEDESTLREIIRLLDGLPLSIELAAARARGLSPAELLGRLQRGLASLGPGGASYGLREALSWSWSLLPAAEQRALSALSIFEGDFSRDAAIEVIGEQAEELLESLLERSLIRRLPDRARRASRFSLLHALRRFVTKRLDPADALAMRQRHAACFVTLSGRLLRERGRVGARVAVESLAEEAANLRVAAEFLERERRGEVAVVHLALAELHAVHGATDLRIEALDRAVQAEGADPRVHADARRARAIAFMLDHRLVEATADADAALAQLADAPPSRLRAELCATRAEIEGAAVREVARVAWLKRALDEAEAAQEPLLALAYRSAHAYATLVSGLSVEESAQRLALHRDAYERNRDAGELASAWSVLGALIATLDAGGDLAESLRLRQEAAADVATWRLPGWDEYWGIQLGIGLLRVHDFDGAVAALEKSVLHGVIRGGRARLPYAHVYLATACLHLRRYDHARRQLLRVRELAMIPGNERWAVSVTEGLVQIALDQGEAEQAAALVLGDTALLPASPSPTERSNHQLLSGLTLGMLGRWSEAEAALGRVTVPPLSPELRLTALFWSCGAAMALDDLPTLSERRARVEATLASVVLPDQEAWREVLELLDVYDAEEALLIADGGRSWAGRHSSAWLRLAARAVFAATRGP